VAYSKIDSDSPPDFDTETNNTKIIRGVSWRVAAGQYNAFSRPYYHAETRHSDVGFRLVRQMPTEQKPKENKAPEVEEAKQKEEAKQASKSPGYAEVHERARKLISQAKTEQAIKILEEAHKGNERNQNQLILLSARFQKLKKDNMLGLMSNSEANIETNRIVSALLEFMQDAEQDDNQGYPKSSISKSAKKK
jgi:hypothetical protein